VGRFDVRGFGAVQRRVPHTVDRYPEQIAERVAAYRKRGVDLILGGFLHFQEEIEYFGSRVLPLVREIEESEQNSIDSAALVTV
jgi:FMNH2-dependent dimethyl sulfone monooxygenase